MNFINRILSVLVVSIVAFSCDNFLDKTISPKEKPPYSQGGRLKFESTKALDFFLKERTQSQNSDQIISEWVRYNKTCIDFISLYEIQNAEIEQVQVQSNSGRVASATYGDSITWSPIIDPRLSLLLNEDHEIRFGEDTIARIHNDYTFLFKPGESNFSGFYEALDAGTVSAPEGYTPVDFEDMKVYKSEVRIYELDIDNGPTGGRVSGTNSCDTQHALNDTWMIRANAYTIWNPVYTSAGLETCSLMKVRKCNLWGCWSNWDTIDNTASFVGMNYDVYLFYGSTLWNHITGTSTGTGRASRFLGEVGGVGISSFNLSGWICGKGIKSGVTLQCSKDFFYPGALGFALTPVTCP
jgi:hypothetical protein